MKKLFFLFIILGSCGYAYGQTTECPVDKVCVSRAVAEKALVDAETVKAQASEIETLKQALNDERALTAKMKIEYATQVGENSALKQNAVSDRAIITELLKYTKKKCMPLSVCLF